ncbi:SufB/SufD family protein [Desulfurococcus mucosus]|uniref:SufBD protein n=1 Tax=Desulfurococcus mucosus (strain ATCC 35584 / DSM 2162 / JCM 9187 / O7/1) TaxID=765177 RepID=E8R931_DESM0|nr:SufD family Fe-S cluster assembly protein [Desulfurococcus mucosus]ADV65007.1 SufBD protein [Desulfurococcus mucosus DSM 2162]
MGERNTSRVREALLKPAPFGPDVDLDAYTAEPVSVGEVSGESGIPAEARGAGERFGMNVEAASYIQLDETALYRLMERVLGKYGVKIMPTRLALEKTDVGRSLAWRLVDPATDKYTASTYLRGGELGYFIYVPRGVRVPVPIYTCLAITGDRRIQYAHNIVFVDEGAEAHVVTGCAVPHGVREGVHIGVSEFYVSRNARLTFTMMHAWADGMHVRPRTAVRVEEGAEYVSYYIIYSPVASLQTYPRTELSAGGKAYLASIVAGSGRGIYDQGSAAVLAGKGSSAEVVSRVVASDHAEVYARSSIDAYDAETRGHIECLGLLLSGKAMVSSIPVITSRKPGALLSHEAAIGMIAEKEIQYLMSKGFTEDEAKSVLVRGFMSIEVPGIPLAVKREVEKLLDRITRNAVG